MQDSSFLAKLVTDADRDGVQRLVVGAIVQHEGRVLLLQRPSDDFMGGIWELPSGKVEPGETLDQAVTREVKEETGLDVVGIGHYLGEFDYRSGGGKNSSQFNFVVKIAAATPVMLQEHDQYAWTELTEEPPVTDAVKKVLLRYQQA
ncbi:NUDIX hydrolase [Nocardia sp. NPDC051570]|uniref:NUDIX hydrolase n=1 Tax=Nocardia sp. NPDC051570 TaxID=3364324 RepID=UPI0037896EF5